MKLLTLLALVLSSGAALAATADQYNQMPGLEFSIGVKYHGVPVPGKIYREKSDGVTICQKTWIPGFEGNANFDCYTRALDGVPAQAAYERLTSDELDLAFAYNGQPVVGTTTKQKSAKVGFCRQVTPVVPSPNPSYACYGAN